MQVEKLSNVIRYEGGNIKDAHHRIICNDETLQITNVVISKYWIILTLAMENQEAVQKNNSAVT